MIVGDVVVLDFPFSDLSGIKARPAVVIAVAGPSDYLVCQITSRDWDPIAVELGPSDFAFGELRWPSHARPAKLFTADEGLIVKRMGRLTTAAVTRLKQAIVKVIDV